MDQRQELLEALCANARESVDDLARQTGLSEADVETTLDELEAEGVLRGYRAVVDWDRADTERVTAVVELDVELDRETGYREIARRLGKHPEVRTLRLVSGDYDFELEIQAASMHAISEFVADRVAPIPEVTQTVTHFVMETYKEGGVVFEDQDDDDRLSVTP